jgi:hypothetical protein
VPIREVVSQISPPIRILLVLAVAVLGVYMLFLRPKAEEVPPLQPTDTSVSQPGKIRDAAEDAVDAVNRRYETAESGAGSATKSKDAAKPGAVAATPAEDLKGLPKPVRKAIRKDQVLVLLFWNEKSADDRAVHASLRKVSRRDGRVFVHAAPLKRISKYGRIARGVNVEQSPTVVVADRDLRAETLVGYVDRTTIDQAVTDALRNSDGLFASSYLRAADKICVQYSNRWHAIPFYYVGSTRQADRRYAEADRVLPAFIADYKAIKPPKKWRSFHNASVADLEGYGAAVHQISVAVTPKMKTSAFIAAHDRYAARINTIGKRADRRFNAKGLLRCGSQF